MENVGPLMSLDESSLIMVSETDESPPMPWPAWCALVRQRIWEMASKPLDEYNVPQDDPMRAKLWREVNEICDRKFAYELAQLQSARVAVKN